MNAYQYSVATRSQSREQMAPFQPFRSVLHSKALAELELSKPTHLINEHFTTSSVSALELPENPFINYSSFTMYESRHPPAPIKQNPFLTATPYRYCWKDPTKTNEKGLTFWEKRKYLEMYAENEQEDEKPRQQDENVRRGQTAIEPSQRVNISKKVNIFKAPKTQQSPPQQPDTASFKRRNSIPLDEENQASFSKVSPINLKSKFSELDNGVRETPRGWNEDKNEQNQFLEDERSGAKEESSLIHKLSRDAECKPQQNMSNSHVLEYQYGSNQFNYYTPVEIPSKSIEREVDRVIANREEERFNFDQKEEGEERSRLNEGGASKAREYPAFIMYNFAKYEMIKVI